MTRAPTDEVGAPRVFAERPRVAMLVYPRMVLLDLVGPQTVLKLGGCDIDLVWKTRAAVETDVGVAVHPTRTFSEVGSPPDVLFVPGGLAGSLACMDDEVVRHFLYEVGSRAGWVTSVCTGGLVLAAAGLLRGYRATTHWAVLDLLSLMGATAVDERVVEDRNRLTGGGVTAGIDFGLQLIARLKGREQAERITLTIEYAPAPPFEVGTPELAGPVLTAAVRERRAENDARARSASLRAADRFDSLAPG